MYSFAPIVAQTLPGWITILTHIAMGIAIGFIIMIFAIIIEGKITELIATILATITVIGFGTIGVLNAMAPDPVYTNTPVTAEFIGWQTGHTSSSTNSIGVFKVPEGQVALPVRAGAPVAPYVTLYKN